MGGPDERPPARLLCSYRCRLRLGGCHWLRCSGDMVSDGLDYVSGYCAECDEEYTVPEFGDHAVCPICGDELDLGIDNPDALPM